MKARANREYQEIQRYYTYLRKMTEGTIITRNEVFDLYFSVTAPTLNAIVGTDLELKSYLRQCLNRNLSFEDFWSIVISNQRRAS